MESGSSGLKEQAWQKSTLLPESAKPARKTPQRLHCLTATLSVLTLQGCSEAGCIAGVCH